MVAAAETSEAVAGVVDCLAVVGAVEMVELETMAAAVELVLYLGALMKASNVGRSTQRSMVSGLD